MRSTTSCGLLHYDVRRFDDFVGRLLFGVVFDDELLGTYRERVQPLPDSFRDDRGELSYLLFDSAKPLNNLPPNLARVMVNQPRNMQNIVHYLCLGFFCWAIMFFGTGSFVATFDLHAGRPACDKGPLHSNFLLLTLGVMHGIFWLALLIFTLESTRSVFRKVQSQQAGQVSTGLRFVMVRFSICLLMLLFQFLFCGIVLVDKLNLRVAFTGGPSTLEDWTISATVMIVVWQILQLVPCFMWQHLMSGSPWSSNAWEVPSTHTSSNSSWPSLSRLSSVVSDMSPEDCRHDTVPSPNDLLSHAYLPLDDPPPVTGSSVSVMAQ
jgi:hypothetical protein